MGSPTAVLIPSWGNDPGSASGLPEGSCPSHAGSNPAPGAERGSEQQEEVPLKSWKTTRSVSSGRSIWRGGPVTQRAG